MVYYYYAIDHNRLDSTTAVICKFNTFSVFDKIFTNGLLGGKRSRNMKIRAQLKILTQKDISQQWSKTSVNITKNISY